MRISYSIPKDWTFTITGGAWLGTDAGDPKYLCDRSPAERTFFTWPDGAQTTSTTCAITAARPAPFVPGLAALLNTSLPLGTLVTLTGKRPEDADYTYDLGGDTDIALVTNLPDGGRGIVWVLPDGLDAIHGAKVTAYNDVFGVAVIEAESLQSIGELIVAPAVTVSHETGPGESWSALASTRTLGAQASVGGMATMRTITVRSSVLTYQQTRGGGMANGMDWQALCGLLARDPVTLMVLYPESHDLAQQSIIFGLVSGLGVGGLAGRYQKGNQLTVAEIPSA